MYTMDGKKLLVNVLVVYVFNLVNCCRVNTFADNAVTLVGAKGVKTVTGCFQPTEELIKVSYIQIINETIPVLRRDAINGLPNLLDVILERDNVQDIEPGAFHNLTKLYLLKIKYNNIRTIRGGVFNGLNLTELCLTDNNIEVVHPNAFDDMPGLAILFLNDNKITSWNSDWFKRSPQVYELNFENNLITTIPFRGLQNVRGKHLREGGSIGTNVLLNNNKIRKIEDGAFEGVEMLRWLFLHKNEIEEISEESLGSLKSVEWVRLDYNNLRCVPEKLVKISPKIIYYLNSNPLSDECKTRFSITAAR